MIEIDKTVNEFYKKISWKEYGDVYDRDHGPRLDALIECFKLKELKGQSILDIGGGLGFLGKRLDPSNTYVVVDGSEIEAGQRLCEGIWSKADLDHDAFGTDENGKLAASLYDKAFFLETIEHIGNPHHALVEIKKLVKRDGDIFISIPTETVWHNAPYPGLLWPRQNFEQFLGQMALPILNFWHYQPKDIGWPAYNYRCRNADWVESRMLFHKDEAKFRGVTPLQSTNM